MKTQWKCAQCKKVISSKQNIEKHIKKLHPDCDKTVKQYSVVHVTSEDIQTKKPKKAKEPKSAYSSFAGLQNIFAHKDLCKTFSLYPHCGKKDMDTQPDPNVISVMVPSDNSEPRPGNSVTTEPAADSETSGITGETELTETTGKEPTSGREAETSALDTETDAQLSSFLNEAFRQPLQPMDLGFTNLDIFSDLDDESSVSMFPPSPRNQDIFSDLDDESGVSMFPPSPRNQDIFSDLDDESGVSGVSMFPPSPRSPAFVPSVPATAIHLPTSSTMSPPVPRLPRKGYRAGFTAPFKARGKCGCEGCEREPCGMCYFCQNKEAK